jgi:cytochrome bd-type quinol oxidase subunit 1
VRPGLLGALALLAMPRVALACATCIASPFGDRTYNWAHLGLLALPFVLIAVVVGIFVYHAGYRPWAIARRLAARVAAKDPRVIKETT